MSLPEPAKAEAGPKGRRPLGWGRGRTPKAEQAPPPQARTLPVPSPRVWGAPDSLHSSPSLQLEVVNCSHCPEGTNEVPGRVLAQGAFCSLLSAASSIRNGGAPPQPPNLLQKPAKPVRPQWLQTPGSQVRALECRRAAIQMSSTSLTGSPLSSARSGPARRQHS